MAEERVRPVRPHHRLTDDGRRMREVLTYSRRGSRFTRTQAAAWEAHHDRWVIPEQALDDPEFARLWSSSPRTPSIPTGCSGSWVTRSAWTTS